MSTTAPIDEKAETSHVPDTTAEVLVAESPEAVVSRLAKADVTPWYRKKNLRYLYFILFPTCIGVEMTSGFDSSMMNGLQAVTSWDSYFNQPRSSLLGLMSASYSLGAIVSLPLVPFITDYFGRRWAIILGSILMIIGSAIQTASQNFAMFVVSRIIIGFGIPAAIVAASSLIGELAHPNERAILGSLFNACYFIGSIVAAAVTLGTFAMPSNWGWRIPSLLQVSPSFLQLVFIWFLPESPRWLISKGRTTEAWDILVKYHAEGNEEDEFVKAEFVQIEKTLELESESKNVGWKELVRTSGMRRRVLIGAALGLFTQWSGNGLTSYFLARILDNVGVTSNYVKNCINLAYNCWSLLNATFFALTVSRFPRRMAYLTGAGSILLIFIGWTIASAQYQLTQSGGSSIAVIVFIFLYSPAYNIAYNALTYTFLVELFPFHTRAKGIAVFQWFSRMAGFFNQFVNPIGIANAGWKYYLSYVIFVAFEVGFIYFLFPETSGKTLEELTFLYEKDKLEEQKKRVAEEIVNPSDVLSEAGEKEKEHNGETEHIH